MMRIVAGLGSIDEYIPYVQAGADEFFCGYVPLSWNEKYGALQPLNRREVMNVNVQLGALEELKTLRNMIDCKGVPIKLTFNSLFYSGDQYAEIADIINECMNIGYKTFIIADPALVVYLRQQGLNECIIHLSGEMSEMNSLFINSMSKYGINRVIFHRKNSIADMKSCIEKCCNTIPEYEAFVLNEMCQFTGAYCNSLHCDEMCHLCLVPYELGNVDGRHPKKTCAVDEIMSESVDKYLTGETGCGLCALYKLKAAGITHLKVVGRGNYIEYEKRDIAQLKKALCVLEENYEYGENAYIGQMKKEIFEEKCSGTCYYL